MEIASAAKGLWRAASAGSVCVVMAVMCGCRSASFYPIGIYGARDTNDFPSLASVGFNVVDGTASEGYLDAAHASGLKVLSTPGTPAGPGFRAESAMQAVRQHDRHPALWAWYLADEPDLNGVDPDAVLEAHRHLKRAGAKKPTALVLYQGSAALHYADLPDILMIDRYPVPWLPLANFEQHVRMARLARGRKAPLIAVIQAFDWSYYPGFLPDEKDFRPPAYEEIRCMTYGALAARADGIFYYCFNDGHWDQREHPETWLGLQAVVAELRERQPLFQAEHLWWDYSHRFGDPARRFNGALGSSVSPALLRVAGKGTVIVPGGLYILAVNNTPEPHDYSLRTSEIDGMAEVPVLGEERAAAIEEGWLKDRFEPFAVHVYGPLVR